MNKTDLAEQKQKTRQEKKAEKEVKKTKCYFMFFITILKIQNKKK